MPKKSAKIDSANNVSELANWEKRFPTKHFEIVNGKLVEVLIPKTQK